MDLFRLKPFAATNIYNFIYGASIFGFTSLLPLYAVSVYAMTTVQSSYVMLARAVGMMLTSVASSFFLLRWGYRKPMLVGSLILSGSLLLIGCEFANVSIFGAGINSVIVVAVLAMLMGVGMGVAGPASNNACLDMMPQRAATITGVRGMFRQGGGAISIAVITFILQFMGNLAIGFRAVFIASSAIVLLTIPFIFAMPDRAEPFSATAKEGLPKAGSSPN